MEYCKEGSLDKYIEKNKTSAGGLSEDLCKLYLAQVILGLEVLHSKGIIHRVFLFL